MKNNILTGKKVYILEDDTFLSGLIKTKFESQGAIVERYPNGGDGLEAIKTNAANIDLVLLDIEMPVLNGYEVLQAMMASKQLAHIPVIVIANSSQPIQISRILNLGARDYMVKAELTPAEIVKKAEVILNTDSLSNPSPVLTSSGVKHTIETELNHQPAVHGISAKNRVLIVEDDQFVIGLLHAKLSMSGFEFRIIENGTDALENALDFKPEVILLDLMLPGLDGFEILKQLKDAEPLAKIPVVVFSNKSDPADQAKVIELGAVKMLIKVNTDLNDLAIELKDLAEAYKAA